ncbi:MAG: hypothetical protein ACRERU_04525 [Methylococcales bacterium]
MKEDIQLTGRTIIASSARRSEWRDRTRQTVETACRNATVID